MFIQSLVLGLLAPLASGAHAAASSAAAAAPSATAAPSTGGAGSATLMAKAQYAFSKQQYADALIHLQAASAAGSLNDADRKNALWMEFLYYSALGKPKEAEKPLEKFVALEPVGTPEPWLWEQTPPARKELLAEKQKAWQGKNGVEIGEPFVMGASLHVPLEKNAEKAHHLHVNVKASGDAVTLETPVANKEGVGVLSADLWAQTEKSGKLDVTVEAYSPESVLLAKTVVPTSVRVVPGLRRVALEELKSGRVQASAAPPASAKGSTPGASSNPNYVLTEGTVKDIKANLTWQRRTSGELYNWAQAKSYCDALALDGGKWRLPSSKELKTIVDTRYEPAIDKALFPEAPGGLFWTASPQKDSQDRAWTIEFDVGAPSDESISTTCSVRCVR